MISVMHKSDDGVSGSPRSIISTTGIPTFFKSNRYYTNNGMSKKFDFQNEHWSNIAYIWVPELSMSGGAV